MKRKLLALSLALVSGAALAQAGELVNADVRDLTSMKDPAQAERKIDEGWIAFRIPALEGTRAPCCWKGNWSTQREIGCKLEESHMSFGTRSDSPPAESLIVYARADGTGEHGMLITGDHCPVDGGGAQVSWMGEVDETAALDWLESLANPDGARRSEDMAVYAIALHHSEDATGRLFKLALAPGSNTRQEAVFWLGASRGPAGLAALERLLNELPHGDTRREIGFALSQNGSDEAVEILAQLSRSDSDPEMRGQALFWLASEVARTQPQKARELLQDAVDSETDEGVLEQAVFAVSQLPDGMGTRMLLDLVTDGDQPRTVRRQAVFWLANSDDDEAVAALEALLTG